VTIERLDVLAYDGANTLTIDVACTKGTYIRVLAEDIGEALGCGAHLIALRRTRVADIAVNAAIPLERFEALPEADRDASLLPVDTLIRGLPRIDLDPALATRFAEGQRLPWPDDGQRGRVRVYRAAIETGAPTLLGTGLVGYEERLAPVRLVALSAG